MAKDPDETTHLVFLGRAGAMPERAAPTWERLAGVTC